MAEKTMTLWTRQVVQMWEELDRTGVYHVKEEYIRKKNDTISDYYLQLYRWYTSEARKYIVIPKEWEFPIWLSVSDEMMLRPVANTAILKLEVPKDKVLLCNYNAWGYVVNYWYVPLDQADEDAHNAEMKKYGVQEDELIRTSKGNFYPLLKRKIINSWGRVFTLPPEKKDDVVATMWEIRKEWVKEVSVYGEGDI